MTKVEIKYNDLGGIKTLKYLNSEKGLNKNITIESNSYVVYATNRKHTDCYDLEIIVDKDIEKHNAGTIIETYRIKPKCYGEYLKKYEQTLIDTFPEPIKNGKQFDYVQIIYPRDILLKNILKECVEKHIKKYFDIKNNDFIHFTKKENAESVHNIKKEDKEKLKQQFDFSFKLKNILIVDDAIDEGKTLNVFLDYLAENNLIDNSTEISVFFIYNTFKESINYNEEKVKDRLHNMNKCN